MLKHIRAYRFQYKNVSSHPFVNFKIIVLDEKAARGGNIE